MTVRNLVVVGVGLIGGSLAAAAQAKGLAERIIGIESNPQSANYALEQGLVDELFLKCLTILTCALCVPSDLVAEWVLKLADHAATVIDVGSVKAPIVEAVQAAPSASEQLCALSSHKRFGKSGPTVPMLSCLMVVPWC